MVRSEILRHITDLRRRHGELEGVEAKAAHTGTPADLFKPLCVFANRPGGGVLLFGLDEDAGFKELCPELQELSDIRASNGIGGRLRRPG